MEMTYKPKVIDFCCGAGGMSEGFRQAGFEIVLGIDTWLTALKTFRHNHNCEVLQADIRNGLELPDADGFIGSPPCQGFSRANQCQTKDLDLSIVQAFLDLVEKHKPNFWVMENVPELTACIKEPAQILKACGYGLRQKRRRAFFGTIPRDLRTFCNGHEHIPAVTACEWKGCSSKGYVHKMNRLADYLGRKATIQECRQEMGYPEEYLFHGTKKDQYIQIGNSVAPPVAKAVAGAIRESL
jgi:site-specific DNA-cytosine methylase